MRAIRLAVGLALVLGLAACTAGSPVAQGSARPYSAPVSSVALLQSVQMSL